MNKETTKDSFQEARLNDKNHQKYKCPNCNGELLQNQLVPTLYMCKRCYETNTEIPFFDKKQLEKINNL